MRDEESSTLDGLRLRAALARKHAGSTIGYIRCLTCGTPVPVERGDVTGPDLDGIIAQAAQQAVDQCPEHGPLKVGRF